MLRPIERIYVPLADHLAARGAAGERGVTLTFAAIEVLIARPLPATARGRGYRSWWSGQATVIHAWYGWQRIGWRVEAVAGATETVSFVRLGIPADDQAAGCSLASGAAARSTFDPSQRK